MEYVKQPLLLQGIRKYVIRGMFTACRLRYIGSPPVIGQLRMNLIESSKINKPLSSFSFCTSTECPKINFTFLNVNNVRINIRIATPAIYIDRGDLLNYFGTKHDAFSHFEIQLQYKLRLT